ncbi:MAG: hypothetical protein BZY80_01230 [SAR202 cluster bacterium Io17-Chloro-G2]|nr:MAG: hypothetical protein BZY80_01230 [SAR202 cluster bacterium Io17-Chloro-G2]
MGVLYLKIVGPNDFLSGVADTMDDQIKTVLFVDDNPNVRSYVKFALEDAGYHFIEAADGWTAMETVEEQEPDLIVLDIMLGDPDMNGLDVCKRLREQGITTPVIFLTIKDRAEDAHFMERAFSLGADDYVTKREELRREELRRGMPPTEYLERKSDMGELIARIKARLTRAGGVVDREYDNYLKVDLAGGRVQVKLEGSWKDVYLTATEFAILKTLVEHDGPAVHKEQIMAAAGIEGDESSLQNHIMRLRQKLEPNPRDPAYIVTHYGVGYRFRALD